MFVTSGILDFFPKDVTKKHMSQSEWKKTAVIKTNCDLHIYYANLLSKRFNLELNKPLKLCHITIISYITSDIDLDMYDKVSKSMNGKKINFEYDPSEIRTNANHWWLKVYSKEAEAIRTLVGLEPTPFFNFHITLGYVNEKNLEHSKYILRTIKKFNI